MNHILQTIDITTITLGRALTILGSSLGLVLCVVLVYMFTHRRTGWRPSVATTILILGPVVSIIVVCIGSNIARAISIGGGLALIRFRNTVEDPRDLRPGDLIFFDTVSDKDRCDHVGLWLGMNRFVHASSSEMVVMISEFDEKWQGCYSWGKRILEPCEQDFANEFSDAAQAYVRTWIEKLLPEGNGEAA